MTVTGKIFKSYAEAIIAKHGFGSNKMVLDWSCDFLKDANCAIALLPKGAEKDDPFVQERLNLWKECYNGQEFLLKNGYLRTYRPEWNGWKGRKPVRRHGSLYIGLTEKGWAVANKYLEAEQ